MFKTIREWVQLIGSICGIAALVLVIALKNATESALGQLTQQVGTEINKGRKADDAVNLLVDWDPFGPLSFLVSPSALLLAAGVAIGAVLMWNNERRKRTAAAGTTTGGTGTDNP